MQNIKDVQIPGFKTIRNLGSGAFGCVYLLQNASKQKRYALKIVGLDNDEILFANQNELSPLLFNYCYNKVGCTTHHIGFYQVFKCSADKLDDVTAVDLRQLTITLIAAFSELFDKKIVHNDIKLSNILVRDIFDDGDFTFVLADYSTSLVNPDPTDPLNIQSAILNSSTNLTIKEMSLCYLRDIYCICISLYHFWCKMVGKNFYNVRRDFLTIRQMPLFEDIQNLEYLKRDLDEMSTKCSLTARLLKLVFYNWFSSKDIKLQDLRDLMTNQQCWEVKAKFDRQQIETKRMIIMQECDFINQIMSQASVKEGNLAKARRKRRLGIKKGLQCKLCKIKFTTRSSFVRHNKNKHPQSSI